MDSLELDEKLKDLTNEEIQYSIISNYRKSLDMQISNVRSETWKI